MKRLISFPLEAGGNVLIEVEEESGATVTRALHPRDVVETVSNTFDAAIEAIKPAAVAVASKFRNFADAPEGVEGRVRLEIRRTSGGLHRLRQHRGPVPRQGGVERQGGDIAMA